MEYLTIKGVVTILPAIIVVMVWINNYWKDKTTKYWILLLAYNFLWLFYCLYLIFYIDDKVVNHSMVIWVIDIIVSIAIAVYGLSRLKKTKNKINVIRVACDKAIKNKEAWIKRYGDYDDAQYGDRVSVETEIDVCKKILALCGDNDGNEVVV
jgi:hypothetical protein